MPHPVRVKTSDGWQDLALTGPPGPAGASGDATFAFTQLSPSAQWVIVHDLDKFPSVMIVDSGNTVITPDIHYDSVTQITVTFGSPTSGKAYLN